jgi:membrane protease YdiL (CAAX protease family)
VTEAEDLLDGQPDPARARAPRSFHAKQAWLLLIAFLLAQLVVSALVGGVFGSFYAAQGVDLLSSEGQQQFEAQAMPWAALAGYLAAFAAILALSPTLAPGRFRSRDRDGFGWRAAPLPMLISAVLLGAALALGYMVAAEYLVPPQTEQEMGPFARMALAGPLGFSIWASIALLLAPPAEELLFRGMLLGGFSASWGRAPAGVMVTLLFTLTHVTEFAQYWPAAGAVTAFGALALWLRLRSESLLPPVCAHVGYNAILVAAATLG